MRAANDVLLGVFFAGILVAILLPVFGPATDLFYCERCSLEKWTWGIGHHHPALCLRTGTTGTAYHRLYAKYVGEDTRHAWNLYSYHWVGGVGCRDLPNAVFAADRDFSAVERLRDRQRIRTVLRSFALRKPYSRAKEGDKLQAIRKLAPPVAEDPDRWWRENGAWFTTEAKKRDKLDAQNVFMPEP